MKDYSVISHNDLPGKKIVCLTLDLEKDHADLLENACYEGVEQIPAIVELFKQNDIPLTCFVQASLLETHSAQIEKLYAIDTDIELHSYSHPWGKKMNTRFEIEKGKETYVKFFGKEPIGYRSPLGIIKKEDYQVLTDNGFKFDSSVFPSIRPGLFNNLNKPTRPYILHDSQIVEFPFAVLSNIIRIPICASYIKLLGKPYAHLLSMCQLPRLVVFGFHMHDLFHLNSSTKIPLAESSFTDRLAFKRIYSHNEPAGIHILDESINTFQRKGYTFWKMSDVYRSIVEAKTKNAQKQEDDGGPFQS